MNKLEQHIREHLQQKKVMQLATAVDGQPWACTVHFYADDDLNLYWISTEARRHSQEIKQNKKVAATIMVHQNTPSEPYIIGLTITGIAEQLGESIDDRAAQAYVEKHAKDPNLLDEIRSGRNPHKFYRLKPTLFVLFDTKNFPNQPRQEWKR